MKNFLKVVGMLTVFFALQTTMVSCADDSNIIKDEQSVEQTQNDTKLLVDPANGGGGDNSDDEDGS